MLLNQPSKQVLVEEQMDTVMYQVTRNWIFDNRTTRGAWTRCQIEALGLDWPATAGWIDEIDGELILASQARDFELGKYIKAEVKGRGKKKRRLKRRLRTERIKGVPK